MRWWLEASHLLFPAHIFFCTSKAHNPFFSFCLSPHFLLILQVWGEVVVFHGFYSKFSALWLHPKFLRLIGIPPVPARLPVLPSQLSPLTTLSNQRERKGSERKRFASVHVYHSKSFVLFMLPNYPSLELWLIWYCFSFNQSYKMLWLLIALDVFSGNFPFTLSSILSAII